MKITQAFIFAAGRGERMRPITDSIPKPLVKVQNKPMIQHTIEKLISIPSIKKIIINGFYLANQVEEYINKLNNPKIVFSYEQEKIETGGALVFAKDKIDLNSPILTINGDVLWRDDSNEISDIEFLCKNWNPKECDMLLGLKKTENYFGYEINEYGGGDFFLASGSLLRLSGIPMPYAFVGMQIINPKIINNVGMKCFSLSHFYKAAIGEKGLLHRVKGVELRGSYYHVGNVENLQKIERIFFKN
jgi:MurNAc alpha-1-phosphate uridylyltransferase